MSGISSAERRSSWKGLLAEGLVRDLEEWLTSLADSTSGAAGLGTKAGARGESFS